MLMIIVWPYANENRPRTRKRHQLEGFVTMVGSVTEQIEQKLRADFAPSELEIIDESYKHRGHSGWREGGESHFQVSMTSARFRGESRVNCQRMVYQTLQAELAGPVHALSLNLRAESLPHK
jgi:BolA protein